MLIVAEQHLEQFHRRSRIAGGPVPTVERDFQRTA